MKALRDRIVWKHQGGTPRAYLDARDLGVTSRIALKPVGSSRATTDPGVAERLAAAVINQLAKDAERRERLGLAPAAQLARFADVHLERRLTSGKYSASWLDYSAVLLDRAVHFFDVAQAAAAKRAEDRRRCAGPRNLQTISTPDVQAFVDWLRSDAVAEYERGRAGGRKGRQPRPFGAQSVRHHLSALSSLFERAIAEGHLPTAGNPVAHLLDPPAVPKSTTELLEADELALLLEAGRTYSPALQHGGRKAITCVYELLATHALTGARDDEVRRMEVRDVRFDDRSVHIRGTKTAGSDRVIPMHEQLREILLPYVRRLGRIDGLLFTSERTGGPITDWRKALDQVAVRAGFEAGSIRTRRFRTSYITHRLLSLDGGVPVTIEQVRQEVGHSSYDMIAKVYARVSRRRERLDPFAFRIERFRERLGERIPTPLRASVAE